jgi:uncharacterized membrane protein YbaN (DUF454 family)
VTRVTRLGFLGLFLPSPPIAEFVLVFREKGIVSALLNDSAIYGWNHTS